MSNVILRPSSTVDQLGTTLVGGTTRWASLKDDIDANYVDFANTSRLILNFPNPTTPSGDKIARVRCRVRARKILNAGHTAAESAIPRLEVNVDGKCGKQLRDRPWWGIGIETNQRIDFTELTTFRPHGNFPAEGVSVAVNPTSITMTLARNDRDDGYNVRVTAVYVDVVYIDQPEVQILRPVNGSTLETTITNPYVDWRRNFDPDGGGQTGFQVKFATDNQYGVTGWDVNNSPVSVSAHVNGSNSYWRSDEPLVDEVYRVYVRAKQQVNGEPWWSKWTYSQFTLGTPRPGVPTIALTPEHTNGRMKLTVNGTSGPATTEFMQIHRKPASQTNWQYLRTSWGAGYVRNLTGAEVLYDYEGKNNEATDYRIRGVHIVGAIPPPGTFSPTAVFGAWSNTAQSLWQDDRWHFQHPFNSALNLTRVIRSQPGRSRASRQEVFQPLGRTEAIVISDTIGPWTGEITVRNNTDAERFAWDKLIADGTPILIKAPYWVPDWPDGPVWYSLSEQSRERIVDNENFKITWDKVTWTQCARLGGSVSLPPPQVPNPPTPPAPDEPQQPQQTQQLIDPGSIQPDNPPVPVGSPPDVDFPTPEIAPTPPDPTLQ